jgi:hypothetical protein
MSDGPSPRALDLVSSALGRALDEVVATGGPLPPVSMHTDEDGTTLHRYVAGRLEGSLAAAREALADVNGDWVLVWDGYLTIEDWRTDALYAHLEVEGDDGAHLFAWRYGVGDGGEVGPLEPAMYLGIDGRYANPGRSHPLPPGEGPAAPHGQVLPQRRRWFRRR